MGDFVDRAWERFERARREVEGGLADPREQVTLAASRIEAAALALAHRGHEVDSVREALGGARSQLVRAADALDAIARAECPHCAPDEACARHQQTVPL